MASNFALLVLAGIHSWSQRSKNQCFTCHLSEPLGWLDLGGFCSIWLLTQVSRVAPPGTWRGQGCGGAPEALNLSVKKSF